MEGKALPSQYRRSAGVVNMTGEKYEIKMSALLFLRGVNSPFKFSIANKLEAAGYFDDIVFTLGFQTAFLDVKHKSYGRVEIKISDLLPVDGNFSLIKYYKSYVTMRQQWQQDQDLHHCGKLEDAQFIVFTNAKLVDNVTGNVGSSGILDLVNTGGELTQFTEHQHPRIYELFSSLPGYKQLLSEAVAGNTNCSNNPELRNVVRNLLSSKDKSLPEKKKLSKQLSFLNSIGDLSCYREFLSQMFFCTEQNAESGLNNLITSELISLFGSAANLLNLESAVETWWRESKVYLTLQARFFQDIIKTLAANITKDTPQLNVIFTRKECDLIRQSFTSSNGKLYVHGDCTSLTIQKVIQSLETQLLVDVSTLQTRLTEVLTVLRLGMCDVLVVDGDTIDTIILNELGSVPHSKGVVVISHKPEHTHLYQQFEFVSYTDVFTLSQLDSDSQRYLMETEVMFQGNPVKLNKLASDKFLMETVSGDVVLELHNTLQIGDKLQAANSLYITRTFLREKCVNEQIFMEMSKGDLSPIEKHIKHTKEQRLRRHFSTEELLELPHRMVLLIAEPGMGKSTEMCNISHMLKQKDPSKWVVMVDLNQHSALLGKHLMTAMEFMRAVEKIEKPFERSLFENQVQSGRTVVIFDGVDEVSFEYLEQVFELLTELSSSKVAKIFVSSRPVLKNYLQDKLKTLAFSLKPFTQEDQESFLMRHWNKLSLISPDLPKFIISLLQIEGTSLSDKLSEFTGIPLQCRMLAEVYDNKAAHFCRTGESNLLGSLDLLQLYEEFVFKKWQMYCEKYNMNVEQTEQLQRLYQKRLMCCAMRFYYQGEEINNLHKAKEILEQHHEFIDDVRTKGDKTGIVSDIVDNVVVFIDQTFTGYLVALWFSEHIDLELTNIKQIYFDENFEIVRIFLDRIINKPNKLHTSVLNGDVSELNNLLSIEKFDVNQQDKGGRTALHLAIMNYFNIKHKVNDSIVDTLLEHDVDVNCNDKVLCWSPLRLAEKIQAWSLVNKLLGKAADTKDLVWIREHIVARRHFECEDFGERCMSDSEDERCEVSVEYQMRDSLQSLVYMMVQEGWVNLIEFILKCGVSVEHPIGYKDTMLCVAARAGQLRLVQLLVEKQADVERRSWSNRTALMWAAGHGDVQVAEVLIQHGADLNTRGRDGHTALTLATRYRFYDFVDLLSKHGAKK